jgi:hypothetical protein
MEERTQKRTLGAATRTSRYSREIVVAIQVLDPVEKSRIELRPERPLQHLLHRIRLVHQHAARGLPKQAAEREEKYKEESHAPSIAENLAKVNDDEAFRP